MPDDNNGTDTPLPPVELHINVPVGNQVLNMRLPAAYKLRDELNAILKQVEASQKSKASPKRAARRGRPPKK